MWRHVTMVAKFQDLRNRELKESLGNDDGNGNGKENGKKSIGLDWQNNNFARATRFFCTFFYRRCTTTTWKCLNSRFVEDVNSRQRLSFSFPELWYSLLEFNSRKISQHLTNWNKRDKVWSSANSLFKWRFRSCHRCRRCCLSSLKQRRRQRKRE